MMDTRVTISPTGTKILIADDDEMIVDALGYQLKRAGYEVLVAYEGEEALLYAREAQPNLILLDVMMPKYSGWEVCKILRQESTVPILMLTARGEEVDRVLGLELGADDYIVKPFSFGELLARIHANLRRVAYDRQRQQLTQPDLIQLGEITIDKRRYVVTRRGQVVPLTQREYDLFLVLVEAQGAALKRQDVLDRVWGEEWIGDPRTLDVHIRWLREKLEDDPSNARLILTVRGVGYRIVAPQELKDYAA